MDGQPVLNREREEPYGGAGRAFRRGTDQNLIPGSLSQGSSCVRGPKARTGLEDSRLKAHVRLGFSKPSEHEKQLLTSGLTVGPPCAPSLLSGSLLGVATRLGRPQNQLKWHGYSFSFTSAFSFRMYSFPSVCWKALYIQWG